MKRYMLMIIILFCTMISYTQERIYREVTGISATYAKNETHAIKGSTGQTLIGRASSNEIEIRGGYWEIAAKLTRVSEYRGNEQGTCTLGQNYPNPFSSHTIVPFTIHKGSDVTLNLYNSSGIMINQMIREHLVSGTYEYEINTGDLLPGTYYYSLTIGRATLSRKMVKLE